MSLRCRKWSRGLRVTVTKDGRVVDVIPPRTLFRAGETLTLRYTVSFSAPDGTAATKTTEFLITFEEA